MAWNHRKFPAQRAVGIFRGVRCPMLAVLWQTFGNKTKNLTVYTQAVKNRRHVLEVYLLNFVCTHSRYCRKEELYPKWSERRWRAELRRPGVVLRARIQQRVFAVWQAVAAAAKPKTEVVLILGLEDWLSAQEAANLWQIVAETGWPYRIGRNAVRQPSRTGLSEVHGLNIVPARRRGIAAMDGYSTPDELGWLIGMLRLHPFGVMLWDGPAQGIDPRNAYWWTVPAKARTPYLPASRVRQMNLELRTAQDLYRRAP